MDTTRFTLAGLAMIAAGATAAQNLTVVNAPRAGESNHAQMLAEAFGGSFSSLGQVEGINAHAGGSNLTDIGYTNGSFTFSRIADSGSAGVINLKNVSGSDESWSGGSYRAEAIGGYSRHSHMLGYMTEGGEFQTIHATGIMGENSSIHPNQAFTWAVQNGNGQTYYGDNTMNGGTDHMVSYAMYDASNKLIGAVLFFEDWHGSASDYDYNDFAVLLTLAPAPQAALLGVLGLGGVGLATGRRRSQIA
ncbi:MAG: hypothetical protein KDA31_10785 [Phycisphaerales bacterium]|nr:hypothetical protein [Phycisphaerales bacterium]MCB9835354.1 hypothetical protein [Phycisphaera sp.]